MWSPAFNVQQTSGGTTNGPRLRFVHIGKPKNSRLFIFPASISRGCGWIVGRLLMPEDFWFRHC